MENTHRTPLFVFLLSGLFLLRFAQRAFLRLLLKEPPRNTRWSVWAGPRNIERDAPSIALRHFDPAAQQPPDFGDHGGHVLVLPG